MLNGKIVQNPDSADFFFFFLLLDVLPLFLPCSKVFAALAAKLKAPDSGF